MQVEVIYKVEMNVNNPFMSLNGLERILNLEEETETMEDSEQ
jgi:hypothetical protein